MTDVNSQHMAGLLDFMYSGQVNVKYEDLQNFLKVAEALQVKGLHGEVSNNSVSLPCNVNVAGNEIHGMFLT